MQGLELLGIPPVGGCPLTIQEPRSCKGKAPVHTETTRGPAGGRPTKCVADRRRRVGEGLEPGTTIVSAEAKASSPSAA